MTRIKKWNFMLVLAIILAIICKDVSAKTYTSDDTINLSSTFHDIFNNYFSETKKYTYFPYRCFDSRVCYFGIDEDGNYLDISYTGGSYNSNYIYSKGVDDNFNVNGVNVFVHEPSSSTQILYVIVFVLVLYVILLIF